MVKRKVRAAIPSFEALAKAARSFLAPEDDDPVLVEGLQAFLQEQPALVHQSWDWRDHVTLPPIRNQGSWNACVSFAAAAMIEARWRLARGSAIRLIPGHIHNCLLNINGPTFPTNTTMVLDACRSQGAALGDDDSMPVASAVCASVNLFRISSWHWLTGRNAILNRLTVDGPMLVTMYVDSDFFRHRGNSVYAFSQGAQPAVLHAVLLVGFDAAAEWALVLNSAGPDWGTGGIGRVRLGSGGLLADRSAAIAVVP